MPRNNRAFQPPRRLPQWHPPRRPRTTFPTIQSAVLSLPNDTTPHTLLILPGNYTEQVNITRPGPVYLYGQTKYPNDRTRNTVNILWRNATGAGLSTLDNAYTSVLTVAPTFLASKTGSGPTGDPVPADTPFGNADFRAYNLNLINAYAPYSAGPALAISISYANAGFYHCGIYSYQDTVYIGKLGNAFFHKTEIAGQTDFLYGLGTAWLQSCALTLRGCGGGITAWKGTNTSFPNKYGVYIHDSTVRRANASLAATIRGKCALGRPWNSLHRSLFAHCELDDSVLGAGYVDWSKSDPRVGVDTLMAEYGDFGPGWNETGRREGNVTRVLGKGEYGEFECVDRVFQWPGEGRFGNTGWIDREGGGVGGCS
ncbi:pectin methylesterase [Pyrenophora seminiperda CCB06]|uniref:pectinesterase n=1 Tax=Pyrenophora seminiperda CCB06 TaxID=1302712 RepID=A0A3M7M1Z8_9PLEO|nr:pectin methylesterase [Pyrenophora seminiperda CCB06]